MHRPRGPLNPCIARLTDWLPATFSKYRKSCDPASRPAQAIISDRCITRLASVYKLYGNMEWQRAHPCRGTHVLSLKWGRGATRRTLPAPVVYINLTDTAGSFANTWFYAANGIQKQLLDVGIAAINGRQDVEVGATSPLPGNNPYTEISRIYGLRPQPPKAPTDFHEVSISPSAENSASPFWWSAGKIIPAMRTLSSSGIAGPGPEASMQREKVL